MTEFLRNCSLFGLVLTLAAYLFGLWVNKRFKSPLTTPLLVALVAVIALLLLLGVDYADYYESAQYLSFLLTPATVSLAVPLYRQLEKLRRHLWAILLGIFSGVLTSAITNLALAALFCLSYADYVTLLPKSVTTAIGIGLSEELGGVAAITVMSIVFTGLMGNCLVVFFSRLFRITHPIAKGIAIGTSCHALGTSKAIELGEVEGAMSGLSIVVAGLMTVVIAPLFATLL